MYKLLLPNKRLVTFDKVTTLVEKNFEFAGEFFRAISPVTKAENKPTLLVFETKDVFSSTGFNSCVIGNLPTEAVSEALKALLTTGYYDFSELQPQDCKKYKDIVVDGGVSNPYILYNDLMYVRSFTTTMSADVFKVSPDMPVNLFGMPSPTFMPDSSFYGKRLSNPTTGEEFLEDEEDSEDDADFEDYNYCQ